MSDDPMSAATDMQTLNSSLELAFRVRNRRNRLFALWVAGRRGLTGREAETYADDVCAVGTLEAGDEAIVTKVVADLAETNPAITTKMVHREITRCAALAALEHGISVKDPNSEAA